MPVDRNAILLLANDGLHGSNKMEQVLADQLLSHAAFFIADYCAVVGELVVFAIWHEIHAVW